MPPINTILLKRNSGCRPNARKIYFLSEGYNTEPKFFTTLFNSLVYFQNKNLKFVKCEKTGTDEGVTDLEGLINIARKYIASEKDKFVPNFDKFIIFFDLDVFKGNIEKVKEIIKREQDNFIFAFTYPAIELFLLMSLPLEEFKKQLDDNLQELIANDFVGNDRFVCKMFKKIFKFDPKSSDVDFTNIVKNYRNIINNEIKFCNKFLDKCDEKITSNIAFVLDKIVKEKFDEIKYSEDE